MKPIILVNKPLGMTPLEVIQKLQEQKPELRSEKIGYAGRLDPMADGLLLLLVGNENTKRKHYEALSKIYTLSVVFGIETDSYDTLGIIQQVKTPDLPLIKKQVNPHLSSFLGTFQQTYPPFSSVHVAGKPLFYWARENKLPMVTIPTKRVTIDSLEINQWQTITGSFLAEEAIRRTLLVKGIFRQEAIRKKWDDFAKNYNHIHFPLLTLTIFCSSGTYMRSIAHELGKRMEIGGCAYRIQRLQIGEYSLSDTMMHTIS